MHIKFFKKNIKQKINNIIYVPHMHITYIGTSLATRVAYLVPGTVSRVNILF